MQFTEVYAYDAPLDTVWAMVSDPAFVKARDEKLEIPDPHVTTEVTDSTVISVTSGAVPASMIPAAAQRFLKGGTKFEIREEWRRVDSATIEGELKASGKGVPANLDARVRMTQNASGKTDATMVGTIKVNVPFLGPKLERQALSFAPRLIAADGEAATAWLAAHA